MKPSRRLLCSFAGALFAVITAPLLAQAPTPAPAAAADAAITCKGPFKQLLEASHTNKRGITLFVAGQTVAGGVVSCLDDGSIVLTSQQYTRIIVRSERIDAAAMQ